MPPRDVWALLLSSLIPLGCGANSNGTATTPIQIPSVTGNWLVESASIYSPNGSTNSGVLLYGGLLSSNQVTNNSQSVTGTLTFGYLGPLTNCHQDQLLSFTGTVNSEQNLTLTSQTLEGGGVISVNLPLPATLSTYSTGGTISISAGACSQASMAAVGALQTPLKGTFTGVLYPGLFQSVPAAASAGTASLSLDESSAIVDGIFVFGLTGTLDYSFGTCTGSLAVSGVHSGIVLGMNGPTPPSATGPTVTIIGGANSTGTSLQIDQIQFTPFPCPANPTGALLYSGTLTQQ